MKLTRGRLVLIDFECQLDGCDLDSPMSDTPLGESVKVLPEMFIWGKMTHPQSGKHFPVDSPDGGGLRQHEPAFTSWASASAIAAAAAILCCRQSPASLSFIPTWTPHKGPSRELLGFQCLTLNLNPYTPSDWFCCKVTLHSAQICSGGSDEPPTAKNDTSYLLAVCLILLQLLQTGQLRQQKLSLQDHEIDNQEQGVYRLGCNWSLFLSL